MAEAGQPNLPPREVLTYTGCYCEENVWKLFAHEDMKPFLADGFAVFISNPAKAVPLHAQRASTREDGLVIWDYHVIAIVRASECEVLDLDTTCAYPSSFHSYVNATFPPSFEKLVRPEFHPKFRVVWAPHLLKSFASDRSHMKNEDGTWQSPPPEYPPIRTDTAASNFQQWVSMEEAPQRVTLAAASSGFGVVTDLRGLKDFFAAMSPTSSTSASSKPATSASSEETPVQPRISSPHH